MKRRLVLGGSLLLLLHSACGFHDRLPADIVSMNESRPLAAEKALHADISFDVGSLEISSQTDSELYSLNLEYDRATYEPEVRYDANAPGEGRLTFKLEGAGKPSFRRERHANRLRLDLSGAVPTRLNVNTGVGDARLSLSGLRINELDLESGVGATRISCYEPNAVLCDRVRIKSGIGSLNAVGMGNLNFRQLDFEGGVGGASLDFSGEWRQDADIRIHVGVGGVSLGMPREVGVRVEAQKHFLSGVHLEGFARRNGDYYSENYDSTKYRVLVRVATGVGGFRINWL